LVRMPDQRDFWCRVRLQKVLQVIQ
jgi:hypothetical protein